MSHVRLQCVMYYQVVTVCHVLSGGYSVSHVINSLVFGHIVAMCRVLWSQCVSFIANVVVCVACQM